MKKHVNKEGTINNRIPATVEGSSSKTNKTANQNNDVAIKSKRTISTTFSIQNM